MEDGRAFITRRRALWVWLMLAASLLAAPSGGAPGLCPPRCACDDAARSASCVAAALEVVPIQLNPEAAHINLTRNNIYNVHFTLGFYTKLITLDISNNKIETLGSRNFESNFELAYLNVSRNEIKSLEKYAVTGLTSAVTLDLDSNKINYIHPHAFRDLKQLQELRLSNNQLVSLESELFEPLVNLRILYLNNNALQDIPTDNLVSAINLEYVSLSSNLILYVKESAAPDLRRLRRLELSDNVIYDVHHSSLDGLTALQYLDLDRNNLTAIPTAALSKLANLTHLSLNSNYFDSIPPVSFQSLFNLRHLHLSRLENVMQIDARAFVDNINLERIWMNDNLMLESIPIKTFHGNPRLTHISIKNNALTTLHASHFPLDQLQSLQVAGNPLNCNCSLLWLWKLGQDRGKQSFLINNTTDFSPLYVDFAEIRCASPKNLENAFLIGVPEYDIGCSMEWITILSVIMSIGVLASVSVSILYYVGALKKCSKDKSKRVMTDSDLTSNLPKMSNGLMYNTNHQRPSDDKVEINRYLMIAPQLQENYHSTPPWHTMNKAQMNGDAENMYQQFAYESIPHHKTMERPHIVYV